MSLGICRYPPLWPNRAAGNSGVLNVFKQFVLDFTIIATSLWLRLHKMQANKLGSVYSVWIINIENSNKGAHLSTGSKPAKEFRIINIHYRRLWWKGRVCINANVGERYNKLHKPILLDLEYLWETSWYYTLQMHCSRLLSRPYLERCSFILRRDHHLLTLIVG